MRKREEEERRKNKNKRRGDTNRNRFFMSASSVSFQDLEISASTIRLQHVAYVSLVCVQGYCFVSWVRVSANGVPLRLPLSIQTRSLCFCRKGTVYPFIVISPWLGFKWRSWSSCLHELINSVERWGEDGGPCATTWLHHVTSFFKVNPHIFKSHLSYGSMVRMWREDKLMGN